jgi:hypothetical protein
VDDFFIGDDGMIPLVCATCGRLLGDDPDDELDGDAGGPICGECYRAREHDAQLEAQAAEARNEDDH